MPKNVPRPEDQHPPEWRGDLNPDLMAGRNYGLQGAQPAKRDDVRTAYDVKDIHARLQDLHDDDLRRIPIVPRGSRLEQGATYIDLAAAQPREFVATAGIEAQAQNCFVPKKDVDYELWNRLIGVDNPVRTNELA